MTLRKVVGAALAALSAAGAASACRGDVSNPGFEVPGHFFVDIKGHKDTTATGDAFFYPTVEDGTEILAILLVTKGADFQLSFSIRDFEGMPSDHDVELDPLRYSGSFYYSGNGQRVTYEIDGGTINITDVQRLTIAGEFNFEASAVDGPNPGSRGQIQGAFTAACDGECVGGGPGPGS